VYILSVTFVIVVVLMLGVIFVNGWTDAPNAIATAVSTRVMRPKAAVLMAVILNFIGALVMTLLNAKVAATLSKIVNFGESESDVALVVLAAAMFSIVIWAVAAWYFGIPTSESHALIAGVTGGAIALGGFSAVNRGEWGKVLIGLAVSSVLGFVMGYFSTKLIEFLFRRVKRVTAGKVFGVGQAVAAARRGDLAHSHRRVHRGHVRRARLAVSGQLTNG
jgi:PiT family inorganic phosphate transporter